MITYRATLPVPHETVARVSGWIGAHRRRHDIRPWQRAATCWAQAVLVLRWFTDGTALAQLARDARIGIATAYRYLHEAINIIAEHGPDLHQVLAEAKERTEPFVCLDGTLIETTACHTPSETGADLWYSGKHKRHGGNIQVLTDSAGFPIWTSPVEPGSTHDLSAARHHVLPALYPAAAAGLPTPGLHRRRDRYPRPTQGQQPRHRQPRPQPTDQRQPGTRRTRQRPAQILLQSPPPHHPLPPPHRPHRHRRPRPTQHQRRPLVRKPQSITNVSGPSVETISEAAHEALQSEAFVFETSLKTLDKLKMRVQPSDARSLLVDAYLSSVTEGCTIPTAIRLPWGPCPASPGRKSLSIANLCRLALQMGLLDEIFSSSPADLLKFSGSTSMHRR